MLLSVDLIEEDPSQPRGKFDEDELQQLTATIRLYGLLTPIGVQELKGGRYGLVYGARRLRAARLAGLTHIPATLLAADRVSLAARVVENQARTNLSTRDLATAVNRLFAEGMTVRQIATICNLKLHQVAAFRSVERFPPFLTARLDTADIRALYDLFRTWEKTGPAIESAMPPVDLPLTVTDARRIIEATTGRKTSSIFLRRRGSESPESADTQNSTRRKKEWVAESAPSEAARGDSRAHQSTDINAPPIASTLGSNLASARRSSQHPKSRLSKPMFVMETANGQRGVLVTDRRATRQGYSLLKTEEDEVLEVAFTTLRPIVASR